MASIVIRNIPDDVLKRFRERAKADGKSAEQLAREAIAEKAKTGSGGRLGARSMTLRSKTRPHGGFRCRRGDQSRQGGCDPSRNPLATFGKQMNDRVTPAPPSPVLVEQALTRQARSVLVGKKTCRPSDPADRRQPTRCGKYSIKGGMTADQINAAIRHIRAIIHTVPDEDVHGAGCTAGGGLPTSGLRLPLPRPGAGAARSARNRRSPHGRPRPGTFHPHRTDRARSMKTISTAKSHWRHPGRLFARLRGQQLRHDFRRLRARRRQNTAPAPWSGICPG